jgi:hypothetical protein
VVGHGEVWSAPDGGGSQPAGYGSRLAGRARSCARNAPRSRRWMKDYPHCCSS